MDATERINDLIVLNHRLAELLARENEILQAGRQRDIAELLEEKSSLGRLMDSRVQAFQKLVEKPGELADVDDELKERLRIAGEKARALTDRNARMLKVAIEANKRVLEIIAEAARDSLPGTGAYGAKGTVEPGRAASAARGAAVTVDQSL